MLQLMKTNTTLSPVREMFNTFADGFAGSAMPSSLPLDIVEMSDKYEITASVPGLVKDQIDLELEGGVLTISTSTCCQSEPVDPGACECPNPGTEGVTVLRKERAQVAASRSIRLPVDVDDENVNASLDNGVLTITVAKPDLKTPRKLSID